MGLQCAKPDTNAQDAIKMNKQKVQFHDMSKVKQPVAFEIKVSNIRILKTLESPEQIKFSIPQFFDIQIPFSDFTNQGNDILQNKKHYQSDIKQPLGLIVGKNFIVHLKTKDQQIEIFKKKFYNLLHGPVHHDHIITQYNTRLLFDLHIDQILKADILLNNLQISWIGSETISQMIHTLSLKSLHNKQFFYQTHKKFQKHEKIKFLQLKQCLVKSSDLRDLIIKLKLTNQKQKDQIFEFFIPFTRFLEKQLSKTAMIDNSMFDVKDIYLEEKLITKGIDIGTIKLEFKCFISKSYAEQIELMTLSEKGIVVGTTNLLGKSPIKRQQLKYESIKNFLTKLNSFKTIRVSQYSFYIYLESILFKLQENQIIITDDLFHLLKLQKLLIQILNTLLYSLQQAKIMQNEYLWSIIIAICHKKIFNLNCVSMLNQQTKQQFGIQFYKFIISAINKIILLTKKTMSNKECLLIHKFLAYAYFKFPWCQKQIVEAFKRANDPLISQQKLGQIGASYCLKSPQKNIFYDWQTSLFRKINKKPEIVTAIQKLDELRQQNKQWAKLLIDRNNNQLFFNFYSTLWDEAQASLSNNGRIMWSYFPKYGQLLSFFMGQMNNNNLKDFCSEMTKCNEKMMKNEKLLNIFMMLIFPKTHLYETYCVIKCLDLIQCYFDAILKHHQKLPYEFHYNYFFTGIRCIFQLNHQFLLQKMLAIIYKFYKIFSAQFIETLNHFILKKVFYDLFLHWNHEVRNIFHYLLIFRILALQSDLNPQKCKSLQFHEKNSQYYQIFKVLYKLMKEKQKQAVLSCPLKEQYFRKMKLRLKEKKNLKKIQDFERMDYHMIDLAHKQSYNEQQSEHLHQSHQKVYNIPLSSRRKWSLDIDLKHPQVQIGSRHMSYIEISLKEFQNAKKQKNPDLKIQMRRKTIEYNDEE